MAVSPAMRGSGKPNRDCPRSLPFISAGGGGFAVSGLAFDLASTTELPLIVATTAKFWILEATGTARGASSPTTLPPGTSVVAVAGQDAASPSVVMFRGAARRSGAGAPRGPRPGRAGGLGR